MPHRPLEGRVGRHHAPRPAIEEDRRIAVRAFPGEAPGGGGRGGWGTEGQGSEEWCVVRNNGDDLSTALVIS
jgi:hypothetical protein